jgi:hypothetical protein
MADDEARYAQELIRDLRNRVETFAADHPTLAGVAMVLELTIFDVNRRSTTIGHVVGAGPSLAEQTGLALGKLRAAIEELDNLQGPQPAITQMRARIETFIAIFEGRQN